MATIYMWNKDSKYFWNDAETHGGFDDAVEAGPFESQFDALADAAWCFNKPLCKIKIIHDEDPRCTQL